MQLVKKLGALRRKVVTKVIAQDDDGTKVEARFYPIRIGTILTGDLAELTQPVVQAISLLLSENQRSAERKAYGFSSDTGFVEEIAPDDTVLRRHDPIDPQLAQVREKARQKAVGDALDVLMNEKTQLAVGRILADSLRDEFDSRPTDEQVLEFMGSLELPVLFSCLGGMLEANTSVFGDLGNSIGGLVKKHVEEMLTTATQAPTDPADDELDLAETALNDLDSTEEA